MSILENLSIIIPIAPGESEWPSLLSDLKALPKEVEIILVGPQKPKDLDAYPQVRWANSLLGRGRQLNEGARIANGKFLWFLHADSRVPQKSFKSLERALSQNPSKLHFFDLAFMNDGPSLTILNTVGVWIRSRLIGLPFGDQGFCLPKSLFEVLGRFPEDAPYGEDHLLVWRAKRAGVRVISTKGKIFTSSRKYRDNGWGKTTLHHVTCTLKQALSEWKKQFYKTGPS